MKEQLERRLKELQVEFENGQKKLAEVDTQATGIRNALLRISGAIQVLKEELARDNGDIGKTESAELDKSTENLMSVEANKVVDMTS